MSSPPPPKRQKSTPSSTGPAATADVEVSLPPAPAGTTAPSRSVLDTVPPRLMPAPTATTTLPPLLPPPSAPSTALAPAFTPPSPVNPRKRRPSRSPKLDILPPGTALPSESAGSISASATASVSIPALLSDTPVKKSGRTNTPWTAAEEQRLKQMRDTGNSWGEIAKAFPNRTEGSVKKHWYKDMHYAEFAEDESAALREAIKEYEANKWKAIGAKLGKPAKACEQYAREHFRNP